MRKISFIAVALLMAISTWAQKADVNYFDVVKVLTQGASSDVIIDKGYSFSREAKGASNDVYYTKGDVEMGENLLWKSSSGSGSLVIVSYEKDAPVRISVLYSDVTSLQTVADEVNYSKAQTKGMTEDADFKKFNFETDELLISIAVPKTAGTMSELFVEKKLH